MVTHVFSDVHGNELTLYVTDYGFLFIQAIEGDYILEKQFIVLSKKNAKLLLTEISRCIEFMK